MKLLDRLGLQCRRGEDGYQDASLIEVVVAKTAALTGRIDDVVPGEALLPTIAGLAAAGTSEPLRIIDFGGAAGLHYRLAKQVFPARAYRWAVIETAQMVGAAAKFENEELRFFTSLDAGTDWLGCVDVMHCVSALQYVPEPEQTLAELVGLRAHTMVWAKLMLGDRYEKFQQTSQLRDNGPGPLHENVRDRKVVYTATRFPKADFMSAHLRAGYRLAWKADSSSSFIFLA